MITRRILHGVLVLTSVVVSACGGESKRVKPPDGPSTRPIVSENGARIVFPAGSTGLERFDVTTVHTGSTMVAISAPARVVASISPSVSSRDPVVLFESPDATATWSQYRQSRLLVERADKAIARAREMFTNLGATAREVSEAENDLATAHAAAAEQEAHMRALGFNPAELAAVGIGSAWVMADVPEADLHEILRGERVVVTLTAFGSDSLVGRAEAIGEVVDPVSRTVKVRIAVLNSARRILPGMFARASFGEPRRAAIVVSEGAVVTVDEHNYVFVRTAANEFRRQEVSLTRAATDSVIVRTGLPANAQVVTKGTMLLKGLSFGY